MKDDVSQSVSAIIESVRRDGDAALLDLAERFDGARPQSLRVPAEEIASAPGKVDQAFLAAFERAAGRIRDFHRRAMPRSWRQISAEGALLGERWTPIDRVGLYVPGGQASYPSTVAMTVVPAQVAGVPEVIVASPAGPDGLGPAPEVLAAAAVLGVDHVYRVGGAQAIAAMAFGTDTVPRVDKLFGPGNRFVEEAKRQLSGSVGIDMLAGPSELVVVADATADPKLVAVDLAAQAEHDASTQVTLLAVGEGVETAVRSALDRLVETQPRRAVILEALERGARFETLASLDAAASRCDQVAPEHLSLQVADPEAFVGRVRHAGAVFLGPFSPVAIGDYGVGPNHVLPTGGTARFASALSTADFMKRQTVVRLDADTLARVGPDAETVAMAEGLHAHAESIRLRAVGAISTAAAPSPEQADEAYVEPPWDAPVKLNQNEAPGDVPDDVKDEILRELRDLSWNRYPQRPQRQLVDAIADHHGWPAAGVLATGGGNLLLRWLYEALLPPGACVLAPAPSFGLYSIYAEAVAAHHVEVAFDESMGYDLDAWERALVREQPTLVVLGAPNNPTGCELPDGFLERVLAVKPACCTVLVDEAYVDFSGRGAEREVLARSRADLLLLRTFSKAFSAAGVRLGYLLGAPDLVGRVSRLVPPYHPDVFAAVAGVVLLRRRDVFEERLAAVITERTRLSAELAGLPGLEVFPSQANFLLVGLDVSSETGGSDLVQTLSERGILVRRIAGHAHLMRISVGTHEEDDRLIEALREQLVSS